LITLTEQTLRYVKTCVELGFAKLLYKIFWHVSNCKHWVGPKLWNVTTKFNFVEFYSCGNSMQNS